MVVNGIAFHYHCGSYQWYTIMVVQLW